jgi:class 3 adenylate cyclase
MDSLLKSSEARLWQMIDERIDAGKNTADVDRRIWDLFGETWAIMFTDLSGFSRQVEAFGILHFLQIIWEHKKLLAPVIAKHDGILIKVEADSLLLIFRKASSAVACGIEMNRVLDEVNKGRSEETKILLCLGIGYGPVLCIGDVDVYGQQVNAASKLGEDTARAHEILLTKEAMDAAGAVPHTTYERLDVVVAGSPENYRLRYPRP